MKLLGEQNRVDDVDHAVRRGDVGHDRRPTLMVLAPGGLLLIVLVTPLRAMFALHPITTGDVIAIVVVWAVWLGLLTLTWRRRLLERYLDLPE